MSGPPHDGTHCRPVSRRWLGVAGAFLLALGPWALDSAGAPDTGHWPSRTRNDSLARPAKIGAFLKALPTDPVVDSSVGEEPPADSAGWHAWSQAGVTCELLWIADEGQARVGYGDHLRCRGPPVA